MNWDLEHVRTAVVSVCATLCVVGSACLVAVGIEMNRPRSGSYQKSDGKSRFFNTKGRDR